MSAREPNPLGLVDQVAPPPWHGPAHVHRLLDDQERHEDVQHQQAIDAGRVCTRCGNAYPATGDYFYRNKRLRGGFRPECKACWHLMPSAAKRPKVQPQAANQEPTTKQLQELDDLARQAAAAILQVLPPWTLITPGSDKEALARQVWPGLWWPFPVQERKGDEHR